jgi:hypothetical protein
MNNKTENTNYLPPPNLSSPLKIIYFNLNSDMRRVFLKIYRNIWDAVCPLSHFVGYGGVLYSFWGVDLFRMKYRLASSELAVLTYLYQLSEGGRKVVHSEKVYSGMVLPDLTLRTKQTLLYDIKEKGYITRSTWNLDEPYLSHSHHKRPVFIHLTSAGVNLIKGIEKDLYNLLHNTSLNEIIGTNKNL